jgi:hypothetical protein
MAKKVECQPVEIVLIGDFRPLACTLWWDAAFGLNENATTFQVAPVREPFECREHADSNGILPKEYWELKSYKR